MEGGRFVSWDAEREEIVHAKVTPAMKDVAQSVYLDSGDYTVTIDPINRDSWIYDGDPDFKRSAVRGLVFDHEAYRRALNWEKSHHGDITPFLPTTSMLDSAEKYSVPIGSRCLGWMGYKRDPSRFGQLPVIMQQLYDGTLINKSPGDIEHEQREYERRSAARLFDTSGYTR